MTDYIAKYVNKHVQFRLDSDKDIVVSFFNRWHFTYVPNRKETVFFYSKKMVAHFTPMPKLYLGLKDIAQDNEITELFFDLEIARERYLATNEGIDLAAYYNVVETIHAKLKAKRFLAFK